MVPGHLFVGYGTTETMNKIIAKIAEYVAVLASCAERTNHANDRSIYTQRLATAAGMFAEFHRTGSMEKLKERIQAERRSYGWSYLSGPEGEEAEKAFGQFADFVESLRSE